MAAERPQGDAVTRTPEQQAEALAPYAAADNRKRERNAAWRAKNPDYMRRYYRDVANTDRIKEQARRTRTTKRGGIYKSTTRPKPEHCELCKRPASGRHMHWDHNHATGLFRGWLCHHCNVGLGHFSDSPELLEAAAEYVRAGGPRQLH
jgi:Recombination endonuclease VII